MMSRLVETFFDVSLYGYLLATVGYAVWFFWRKPKLWIAGTVLLGVALASQTAFIIARTVVGGRPPLANTFETLVFLAACVAVFFLVTAKVYGWRAMAPIAALVALFMTLFAYLLMQDEIDPVMPALRDNFWLTVHVVFCFVSYAAFFLAYVGALAFLSKVDRHAIGASFVVALTVAGVIGGIVVVLLSATPSWKEHRGTVLLSTAGGSLVLAAALWPLVALAERKLRIRERLPDKSQLEEMVYKTVAFGFPFLTLGIITGSVWANQAWGRYWGWDDKEVASLITWLVFAVYLHLRLVPKWRGPWVAWIPVVGVWCVLFTWFGVNYLLSGLHAYV
jgi:cytochrome c-type biogenesis protein CcsB